MSPSRHTDATSHGHAVRCGQTPAMSVSAGTGWQAAQESVKSRRSAVGGRRSVWTGRELRPPEGIGDHVDDTRFGPELPAHPEERCGASSSSGSRLPTGRATTGHSSAACSRTASSSSTSATPPRISRMSSMRLMGPMTPGRRCSSRRTVIGCATRPGEPRRSSGHCAICARPVPDVNASGKCSATSATIATAWATPRRRTRGCSIGSAVVEAICKTFGHATARAFGHAME